MTTALNKERVLVAMSGGVDSSVAAARLVDQGYDVVGVTLHLWDYPDAGEPGSHGKCCAPEDQYDAKRVADALGFPHFTFDRRELFAREVVGPFVDAYGLGETPSPCTTCNRSVKLGQLLDIARRLGATKIATGHYARVVQNENGQSFLSEGADKRKDQSYFLYASPPELVSQFVFPLGESTKAEVRDEALARALPGANKGESQELCFVGAGDHAYAKFVDARLDPSKKRPGRLLADNGQVVGEHTGVHNYTVGQRKGLGVALGKPVFVRAIDAATGDVHLADASELGSGEALVSEVHLAPGVALPMKARVRVRYRHEGANAELHEGDAPGTVHVRFDVPVRSVARGQTAVFYDGERVLGGGRIVGAGV